MRLPAAGSGASQWTVFTDWEEVRESAVVVSVATFAVAHSNTWSSNVLLK